MPVPGLDHYDLRAPRELMETLRAFYVEVVGLEPVPRPPFVGRSHAMRDPLRDCMSLEGGLQARPRFADSMVKNFDARHALASEWIGA